MAFRRIQTKCEGYVHLWMCPRGLLDENGNPPKDWTCVCGELYPNGEPVIKKEKPSNLAGRCVECYEYIDDHPTDKCRWDWR